MQDKKEEKGRKREVEHGGFGESEGRWKVSERAKGEFRWQEKPVDRGQGKGRA